jgi:outer membrane protein assembly factor BamA
MRITTPIFLFALVTLLSACSNTRFLAGNQVLYTGREKVEIIQKQPGTDLSPVRSSVKSITYHKVNNGLFGHRILPPIGLWVHNYWKVDEEKKLGRWIHKTLASDPVLISDVNPELRAQKIENELFDDGYFRTNAWSVVDTCARNPRKAGVKYFVEVFPPFHYDHISFEPPESQIDTLLMEQKIKNFVKTGDRYDLSTLEDGRRELSRGIQNEGYFYFNPDFIELTADTTIAEYRLNLSIGRNRELPSSVLAKYWIGRIAIHISQPSEPSTPEDDTTLLGDITIVSSNDFVKPGILASSVYFHTGEIYSYTAYQSTVSHLNNLGIFRSVRITYEPSASDSLLNLLDVRIDLVMADNINLNFEADLVTKSTGFAGPEMLVGISSGNTFKGAEKIHLALNGGLEWQWGTKSGSELGTLAYEFGIGSGLTFPRIILPGRWKGDRPLMLRQTSVNFDYSILNRTAYYKMSSSMINIKYDWGRKREMRHSFSPLYYNSVNLLKTTAAFDSVVEDNIYIRKSFEEQLIFGLRYDFSYDNTFKNNRRNLFFHAAINTSGNLLDAVAGIGKDASERPYVFMNNIYSQYVKISTDFRYYRNLRNKNFVFRLYAGIGIPYGNSTVLPYVEQYFSGGAYSIRGFTARYLGPGSYHDDNSGFIDQSGDLKLESNLEFRFGLSKVLKGALFLETGNIWLINEDENRPGAKFEFNTFYNQLAVGGGLGLRFDFNFFVVRTDFGIPLRNPYPTEGENWLTGSGSILSRGLFYLAIGYPF